MEIPTVEDFRRLEGKVDSLTTLLTAMLNNGTTQKVVDMGDIARMKGVSRSQLYNETYLLPNFGRSDYPQGRKRWNMETWVWWESLTIDERLRTR